MFYCYKYRLQGSGCGKLGALWTFSAGVPAGLARLGPWRSQVTQHPASCILHPVALLQLGCCCKLGATSLWVLGAGKLHSVQPSCTKSTLVLVYSFGTLHRGGVACRQSVSTMLAVVVLVHLLGL